ncbi:UDP-N-acetylmuramoyl-tripeptide--D-alanyl-D-alanine ligase [Williamsia maris]|uniref:UDP-N-acetylmuramoyl-tripeptide--D-alanyl-D-alanine ligase n=1 Tax=Williamsia maris TaxID=72806 RepID=A0ABT1HFE0_9NOCA|nr:UDP-N-acetylmuramoyl-tripeptide--D-alanyl-D-alanine ligase [Williamsia maris]MCP2176962.1 hypothetical protein [Williamsia maris]
MSDSGIWVLDTGGRVGTDIDHDTVRGLIRDLVGMTRDRGVGRSWAVIAELDAPELADENDRALAHDRVGRLAVRLAVDTVISVGESRSVRALHQGAVMEGSWGEEALLVADATAALEILNAQIGDGDVVLVAAGRAGDLSAVTNALLDSDRWTATLTAAPDR